MNFVSFGPLDRHEGIIRSNSTSTIWSRLTSPSIQHQACRLSRIVMLRLLTVAEGERTAEKLSEILVRTVKAQL